jgi:zinc protease
MRAMDSMAGLARSGVALTLALVLWAAALVPARAEVQPVDIVSAGGIGAWLIEAPEIPIVALEIRFPRGAAGEPAEVQGVTQLMTALLEEGAGALDARGFAAARDAIAAEFSFSAGQDWVSVSALYLTENEDRAVELLALALNEPRFDPEAVARVRDQMLAALRSDERNPAAIAGRAFDAQVFGAHAYVRDPGGTAETLARITPDDLRRAHQGALAREGVIVAAVGDIDAERLGAVIDRLLGGLPASGRPAPDRAEVAPGGGVEVVPFPGPQSVIRFGHEGLPVDDPDFITAFVVDDILGGGRFSARLTNEVREKRGLTYGIGSGLNPMRHAALIEGQVQTANATTAEVIGIIRDEWARMAAGDFDEADLAAAKTYLTGSYPLRFEGNGSIAAVLAGLQMQGYAIDYPMTRNARINAVTLEDARRVAARLYRPDALRFVVVGTPEGLPAE